MLIFESHQLDTFCTFDDTFPTAFEIPLILLTDTMIMLEVEDQQDNLIRFFKALLGVTARWGFFFCAENFDFQPMPRVCFSMRSPRQDLKIDNENENAAKKMDKKWKRKTRRCEILDCAFSANSDGLSIADMADDTQLSLEELMILKEESRILHDKIGKLTLQELRGKDVILVFPEESKKNKTVRVLKLPKTESSIRKVFLPKSVAEMLVEWKKGQDKIKETLGDEYMDYNLVMATPFGLPIGTSSIRKVVRL